MTTTKEAIIEQALNQVLTKRANGEINRKQFEMLINDLVFLKKNEYKEDRYVDDPKIEKNETEKILLKNDTINITAEEHYGCDIKFDFAMLNQLLEKHKNSIALSTGAKFKACGPNEENIYNLFLIRFVAHSWRKYVRAFMADEQMFPELKLKDKRYSDRPDGKLALEDITFSRDEELREFCFKCFEAGVNPAIPVEIRNAKIPGHAGLYEAMRVENRHCPKGAWEKYVANFVMKLKQEAINEMR